MEVPRTVKTMRGDISESAGVGGGDVTIQRLQGLSRIHSAQARSATNPRQRLLQLVRSETDRNNKAQGHADLNRKLARDKSVRDEKIRLKESTVKLNQLYEQDRLRSVDLEKRSKFEIQKKKADCSLLKQNVDKVQERVNLFAAKEKKNKINYRAVKGLIESTHGCKRRLEYWSENHSISISILEGRENPDGSGAGSSTSVLLELRDIPSTTTDQIFGMEFSMIKFSENKFKVKRVVPPFPGHKNLINLVNEDQNFVRFLRECKKCWIQSATKVQKDMRDTVDSNANIPLFNGEHTVPMFETSEIEPTAVPDSADAV